MPVSAGERCLGGRCGAELRALRPDRAQPLAEACPRPWLDLVVAGLGLRPRRLEVLEPGVGLLDHQQLLGFSSGFHGGIVGPAPDGARTQRSRRRLAPVPRAWIASRTPIASRFAIIAEPPTLTNGSGIPVTGDDREPAR